MHEKRFINVSLRHKGTDYFRHVKDIETLFTIDAVFLFFLGRKPKAPITDLTEFRHEIKKSKIVTGKLTIGENGFVYVPGNFGLYRFMPVKEVLND